MRLVDQALRLLGSSSGETIVRSAAAASGAITLPAGVTDFSATGGAGQVVKQVTAGGPFTVGPIAASEIGGLAGSYLPLTGGTLTGPGNLTMAGNLSTGTGVGAGAAGIEVGNGRAAQGFVYIDLHSEVGTDYELRLQRNPGVNGEAILTNAGAGPILLSTPGGTQASLGYLGPGSRTSNWWHTLRGELTSWASFSALAPLDGAPIQVGVIGAMRSSDPTISGARLIIGVEGVAINDNATIAHSAYAGYFEAWRKAGAIAGSSSIGIEIDVAECNSGIATQITAYSYPNSLSAALWLGSGANLLAEIGVPIYPAHVAIGIIPNGSTFKKGVVFNATALDTATGGGGNGVAVEMARGQSLRWVNSGGTVDSEFWGDATGLHLPTIAGDITIGGNLYLAGNAGTSAASIELGQGRTGAGAAYIDFHASVGTDYDFRILREAGANGNAQLQNAGTGGIIFQSAGVTTGFLTIAGNFSVAGDVYVHGNSTMILGIDPTGYTVLDSPDSGASSSVWLGNAADPAIYYGGNIHQFNNSSGSTAYATIDANGIKSLVGSTISLFATGSVFGGPTGGAKGAGTINAVSLYLNGTVVSTSDARLKREIEVLPDDCLSLVAAIAPKQFRFNPVLDDAGNEQGPPGFSERRNWGFVAQDVQTVMPDAVEEDGEGILGLSTADLLAVLWKAVQELSEKLASR